jgi:phytoene dehydrogenase-like protein
MSTDPTDDPSGPFLSRRGFLIKGSLIIAGAAGLAACNDLFQTGKASAPGQIVGADWHAGHRLLEKLPKPEREEQHDIVIVGGGVAGLSAARELAKRGHKDFVLLELSDQAGGNAASGENAVSPYPWAAHYIPIPGSGAAHVRELFEELGIVTGYKHGLPVYNEYYLCADPQERLFLNGQWQEGLVPQYGIAERDRAQISEFLAAMDAFRKARGSDNKRAFAIPIDESSQDSRFTRYDSITMARFLAERSWDSPALRWYVNYCCRDDYGSTIDETSAWAGIHYFASRDGKAANAESHAVVTWPDGIGWVVKRMAAPFADRLRTRSCVLNIEEQGSSVVVDHLDLRTGRVMRTKARAVVYAAPRFTAFRTLRTLRQARPGYAQAFTYALWAVANVTIRGLPEGKGASLAWDNVSYYSDSLGYVVATHQDVARSRDRTVLTWYQPLTKDSPSEERAAALKRSHTEWADLVVRDLSRLHPGIESHIERIDVWVWGHAMIRPIPGFIWGNERRDAIASCGRVHFGNSDMSGISIFEEAQYRGIMAARAALG